MPAITVDTLTLPRVVAAVPGEIERPVKQVSTGPRGFEGRGFPGRARLRRGPVNGFGPVRAHGRDG